MKKIILSFLAISISLAVQTSCQKNGPAPSSADPDPSETPSEDPSKEPSEEPSEEPVTIHVSSITLSEEAITLQVGETAELKATVLPEDAADKSYTWNSDNDDVATVTDGLVTAVSAGSATITVKTTDGEKTATCAVTVEAVVVPGKIVWVSGPDDGAKVSITHDMGFYDAALEISWDVENSDAPDFVLKVSSSNDMSDAVLYELEAGVKELTLNNKMVNHAVAALSSKDLWYQIASSAGEIEPSSPKSITVETEFGSFLDPRDGEIYPTVDVDGRIWMCENLRALKYSDGEELFTNGLLASTFYTEGYLGVRAGVHYAYANAVRNRFNGQDFGALVASGEQIQGICPEGWHVAANADFDSAIAKACEVLGKDNAALWTGGTPEVASAFRFRGDYTALADGKKYGNELGLYFVPAGLFQENTPKTGQPENYAWNTYLWSATMMDWWFSYSFENAQWNDTISSYRYGNNPQPYSASLPVRCVKNL